MIEIYLCAAITLLVIGVVIGVVAVVSLGIRREDRRGSRLPVDADDRVARGARRLTGLHVRRPAESDRPSVSAGAADVVRPVRRP